MTGFLFPGASVLRSCHAVFFVVMVLLFRWRLRSASFAIWVVQGPGLFVGFVVCWGGAGVEDTFGGAGTGSRTWNRWASGLCTKEMGEKNQLGQA